MALTLVSRRPTVSENAIALVAERSPAYPWKEGVFVALNSRSQPLAAEPPKATAVVSSKMGASWSLSPPTERPSKSWPEFDLHKQSRASIYALQPKRRDHARTHCCLTMETHPRATSSVYSASFDLDTLLEQITAQTQGHQRGENDQLPKSHGVARSWEQRATAENTTLPESCQIDQTLEQQLIMQNAELRDRLDKARGRFARLYNAMKKAMEVSRELYEIHLNVAHENDVEQKEDRASGEYF